MKPNTKLLVLLILSCLLGFIIAKVDTSKNWNDTGITVGLVLLSAFMMGISMPKFAWLFAIIIGGFIFIFNVALSNNYGSAGAIAFAFIGAYGGVLFKKLILNSALK
jgi:hypothetical protein